MSRRNEVNRPSRPESLRIGEGKSVSSSGEAPLQLRMNRTRIYRWFWLSAIVLGVLLLGAAVLLVATSWRGMQRLQPLNAHLADLSRVQETGLRIQDTLIDILEHGGSAPAARVAALRTQLHALVAENTALVPATRARLAAVDHLLERLQQQPDRALITATIKQLRGVLSREIGAHQALLRAVDADTRDEFHIAVTGVVAFVLLAALAFGFLRRRIQRPLGNLASLMGLLAERDYRSVPTDDVAPPLQPLFSNYNRMVERLARLEREDQARRDSLEREVRTATEALLEQQRNLGRAERLAAVGEVAAGLAHELRNPLAGMQMALVNLRQDVGEAQRERLDLVISELQRIVHLLNTALGQARQQPEPATDIVLPVLVAELLSLTRYQIPPRIELRSEVPDPLRLHAPAGQLRQAVLNLVLNAAQAMDGQPGCISVRAMKQHADIVLEVCDEGPGFARELLDSGVRAFGSWRKDGTGLGLAMVRRFAHDLGGELHLSNRKPRGACAALRLPQREPHV